MNEYVVRYKNISVPEISELGVSDTLLSDVFRRSELQDIRIADGFAISPESFRRFVEYNQLSHALESLAGKLDSDNPQSILKTGQEIAKLIAEAAIPADIYDSLVAAYNDLSRGGDMNFILRKNLLISDSISKKTEKEDFGIWSSGGVSNLIESVRKCFAAFYLDSILDKDSMSPTHEFSVGVQFINASENAAYGFALTADPDSGFPDVIQISAVWGTGQKTLFEPDEVIVYKPNLVHGNKSIIQNKKGNKSRMMSFENPGNVKLISTPADQRQKFVLNDEEILTIANWGIILENYYNNQIYLEWARDGLTDELYILQIRPGQVKFNKEKL